MIYTGQFTSRDNTIFIVEIDSSKVDGLNTKKEIALGVPPFTVKYEGDDDINKPVRMSSATITVLTTDTPWDLVTNKATDVSVKLYKRNVKHVINGGISLLAEEESSAGATTKPEIPDFPVEEIPYQEIVWAGYVEPSVYDMPQDKNLESFEINCIDEISALQYKFFGKGQENRLIKPTEIRFDRFIKEIMDITSLKNLYTPMIYEIPYNDRNDLIDLDALYVSEKAFIDDDCYEIVQKNGEKTFEFSYEDNDTYLDILEKMMNFLNCTFITYKENIYIIPIDYMTKEIEFFKWDFENNTKRSVGNVISAEQIKKLYAGTSVSQTEMYNQITVKAKMKDYDSVFPDFFEDKYLTNIGGSWAYEFVETVEDDQKDDLVVKDKCRWRIYDHEFWKTHYYDNNGLEWLDSSNYPTFPNYDLPIGVVNDLTRIKGWNGANIVKYGASVIPDEYNKYKDYKKETSLSNYVVMMTPRNFNDNNLVMIESINPPSVYFNKNSYIIFKYSVRFRPNNGSPWHLPSSWKDYDKDDWWYKEMWLDSELSIKASNGQTYYYYNVDALNGGHLPKGVWRTEPSHCRLPLSCEGKSDHIYSNDWNNLINSGIDGNQGSEDGFIIKPPVEATDGYATLNFKLFSRSVPSKNYSHATVGTWIKNFSIGVQIPKDETIKEWSVDSEYKAVISDEYVNEGESIDFDINSFNEKVPSWTCVMYRGRANDYKMIQNVKIRDVDEPPHLMEEWKIYHKIKQHQKPMKILDTQIEGLVSPIKYFIYDGECYVCDEYEIDYYDNKTNIKLTQLWNF